MDEFTIMIGGIPYVLKGDGTAKAAIDGLIAEHASLKADCDREAARADTAEARTAELEAELKDARDPAKLEAAAKARSDLADKARKVAGKDIALKGSDHEIRLAALDAAGVKLPEERRDSEAYVEARFDAASEQRTEAGTVESVVRSIHDNTKPVKPAGNSALRKARADYLARQAERRVS